MILFIFMPVDAQPTYIRCGGRHFHILFTLNIDHVATEQKFGKDLRQYLVDLDFFIFQFPTLDQVNALFPLKAWIM